MTIPGPQDLVVTRATPEDWAVVARWAGEEGWNPGFADPACFFAQDPEGFFIGRLDGEPVSSVSVVTYGCDYAFLGFYLVRPELRGRGHGLATWKTALAHAGARTVGLDGVVAQQDNYRQSGFEPAHRTFRYSGAVPVTAVPDGVRPLADAGALAAYDNACHPADRPRFLERWLTADGHRALARTVDGRLTGYGVIRPGRDALRIGPLFADTAADARALFEGLAAEAAGRPLAIDVPEPNTAAVALVEEYGLTPSFETARMYTGPVRPYAAERVFGITTLELG
ncbi:GNAT family N-acetyltransferase [Streptomyces griseiscabiei]|uniref:GNAT family N-acetyltransferase n=1 Tax=Streptomyces griseiscabiei TaxID=2993540 RepID=A0ABU4L2V4_9ACTN|nr:GNAT family N-acetyltransferase [Streptomyces griseiscabiei]MBZ3901416.1 GNAT family N-acetyltransferase [Streptomyces griseiscabiei]MDX2910033.1 GNAT family N-acetyltransferase [Streptomyces griseiscabiei]